LRGQNALQFDSQDASASKIWLVIKETDAKQKTNPMATSKTVLLNMQPPKYNTLTRDLDFDSFSA
jgi:hypothetical protein